MEKSLADLQQGAVDFDDGSELDLPEDFDSRKFQKGQLFFQKNVMSCFLAMKFSLICGLSVSNLLDVLVATGKSTKPQNSFRRYAITAIYVTRWHYGDTWNELSAAGKSIRRVRQIHNGARKFMINKTEENGKGSRKAWISQYDMSLVQCGFMGALIMYPAEFGIKCSKQDLDDYVYFWRWVGYLLGIKDRNNICYDGYNTAYRLCKEIEKKVLLPALKHPPADFVPMATAYVEGEKLFTQVSLVSVKMVLRLTFNMIGENWNESLNIFDKLRVVIFKGLVNCMYYIPGLSWCLSKLSLYLLERARS